MIILFSASYFAFVPFILSIGSPFGRRGRNLFDDNQEVFLLALLCKDILVVKQVCLGQ